MLYAYKSVLIKIDISLYHTYTHSLNNIQNTVTATHEDLQSVLIDLYACNVPYST